MVQKKLFLDLVIYLVKFLDIFTKYLAKPFFPCTKYLICVIWITWNRRAHCNRIFLKCY